MRRLASRSLLLLFSISIALVFSTVAGAEANKIEICHTKYVTPGKGKVAVVPKVSWDVHKAHGDCKEYLKYKDNRCRCGGSVGNLFKWGGRG